MEVKEFFTYLPKGKKFDQKMAKELSKGKINKFNMWSL